MGRRKRGRLRRGRSGGALRFGRSCARTCETRAALMSWPSNTRSPFLSCRLAASLPCTFQHCCRVPPFYLAAVYLTVYHPRLGSRYRVSRDVSAMQRLCRHRGVPSATQRRWCHQCGVAIAGMGAGFTWFRHARLGHACASETVFGAEKLRRAERTRDSTTRQRV